MAGIFTTLTPVVSSNLAGVGWTLSMEGWKRVSWMEIEFLSGSLYLYKNVSQMHHAALLAAPSKGKYFWAHIRPFPLRYPYVRLR